jgi:hypothetical protein
MNELNDFLNLISEAKRESITPKKEILGLSEKIKHNSFFNLLENTTPELYPELQPIVEPTPPEIIQEEFIEEKVTKKDLTDASHYNRLFKTNVDLFNQPKLPAVAPEIKALTDKIQYMENWLTKISMAGAGGGEVNFRWLDDVDRSSIYAGRYLRYNSTTKLFEFAEVNPHDVVYTTNYITSSSYVIDGDEYYVGINYAGPVTITLPVTPNSGRSLVLKDESGNCANNPITVVGTVDNDPAGFTLQINNGSISLIYRDGWRII